MRLKDKLYDYQTIKPPRNPQTLSKEMLSQGEIKFLVRHQIFVTDLNHIRRHHHHGLPLHRTTYDSCNNLFMPNNLKCEDALQLESSVAKTKNPTLKVFRRRFKNPTSPPISSNPRNPKVQQPQVEQQGTTFTKYYACRIYDVSLECYDSSPPKWVDPKLQSNQLSSDEAEDTKDASATPNRKGFW